MTMIQSPRIPSSNKLRLAILYALRYQKLAGNAITSVVDALIENGVSADRARVSNQSNDLGSRAYPVGSWCMSR